MTKILQAFMLCWLRMEDENCVYTEVDKIVRVLVGTDVSVNGRLQNRCSNSCDSYYEYYINLKISLVIYFQEESCICHQRN